MMMTRLQKIQKINARFADGLDYSIESRYGFEENEIKFDISVQICRRWSNKTPQKLSKSRQNTSFLRRKCRSSSKKGLN